MSSRLAERLTQMLIASAAIEDGDRELYSYGCFLLVSNAFFLLVTAIIGFLLGIPKTSVLFYVLFTLLRGYAGGVHAKTENVCTVLTTLAMAASLTAIRLMETVQAQFIPWWLLGIGSVVVLFFSPLDTAEKPLKGHERTRYKVLSVVILLGYLFMAFVVSCLAQMNVIYAIACSVFLEGILLIAGKIYN